MLSGFALDALSRPALGHLERLAGLEEALREGPCRSASARPEERAAILIVGLDEPREQHHELLALGRRQGSDEPLLGPLHLALHARGQPDTLLAQIGAPDAPVALAGRAPHEP